MNPQPVQSSAEIVLRRLVIGEADECWPWCDRHGQPMPLDVRHYARADGEHVETYVLVYRLAHGDVPCNRILHHTCESPGCNNPRHTVPITRGDHNRVHVRNPTGSAMVTHCKRGHPYDAENTYTNAAGKRWCRACDRERKAAARRAGGGLI